MCVCVCVCVCVCAIFDLKVAYFKQILVKILAVVQSFQVANELSARHPLADVLKRRRTQFIFFISRRTFFRLFYFTLAASLMSPISISSADLRHLSLTRVLLSVTGRYRNRATLLLLPELNYNDLKQQLTTTVHTRCSLSQRVIKLNVRSN